MERQYGIDIKWLAVTCFEIRFGDMVVVSDPYVTECKGTELDYTAIDRCNIITVSHSHYDHVTDIPRLCKKFSPRIITGAMAAMPMARWLNYDPALIYPTYPGVELDFGAVKIRTVYGRHKSMGKGFNDICERLSQNEICKSDRLLGDMQAIGSMEYCNYLFTAKNGVKILLWGSEPTVEQENLCRELHPDIAIIQRGRNAESVKARAAFAANIGAKVLIPHHQDAHAVDNPSMVQMLSEEFLRLVPGGKFIEPVHGEWINL